MASRFRDGEFSRAVCGISPITAKANRQVALYGIISPPIDLGCFDRNMTFLLL